MFGWLFNSKTKDKDTEEIERELHDIYGYSKKELSKMSDSEKEILLYDEYEEDEESFF